MKLVNLIGKKFGKLTVKTRVASSRNGSKLWNCLCDCGNKITVTTRHLNRKKNTVRSCGCLIKKSGSKHKDWKGYGEISGAWWSTRIMRSQKSLKSRKSLEISITIEDAWVLYLIQEGKCKLSGLPIQIDVSSRGTASLDRIDSSKGYTIDNVQWVHKDINFMKKNYSQDYFIDMCRKVAEFVQ